MAVQRWMILSVGLVGLLSIGAGANGTKEKDKPVKAPTEKAVPGGAKASEAGKAAAEILKVPGATNPEVHPAPADPAEAPDIEFEEPIFDFGRAKAGSQIKHEFTFKNTGKGVLKIENVKTNCGCTVTGKYEKEIPPGQHGKIPITFDTSRFKGKVKKPMSVFTNVPDKHNVTFVVKGDVWQPITIVPGSAAFGSADSTSPQEKVITITNNMEEPLVLTDPRCDSERFDIDLETVQEGKLYKLTVRTVPPLEDRFNRSLITLATSMDDVPLIEIMASAYVPPPVLVTPSMLRFPTPVRQKMTRYVYVRNSKREQMTLKNVKVSDEKLEVKVIDDRPKGQSYRIVITAPEGYELPDQGVDLTFETDLEKFPNATVPLRPLPKRPVTRPARSGSQSQGHHEGDGHNHGGAAHDTVRQAREALRKANAERRAREAQQRAQVAGENSGNDKNNKNNKRKANQERRKKRLVEILKKKEAKNAEASDGKNDTKTEAGSGKEKEGDPKKGGPTDPKENG